MLSPILDGLGRLLATRGRLLTLPRHRRPLADYIEALHRQQPDITLTVIVPQIVPAHRWESILPGRIAQRLPCILIRHEGIVVTSVPFHVKGSPRHVTGAG